jgi:hypothetical protein
MPGAPERLAVRARTLSRGPHRDGIRFEMYDLQNHGRLSTAVHSRLRMP